LKLIRNDLVFDIGANHGEDTAFYLSKGFQCIAVEANPLIASKLRERFAEPISMGMLTLLNIGVWNEAKTLTFYVNEHNDHWSSFDRGYGTRDGTSYHTLEVECILIDELLERYGVPRYMKIDVEGADRHILESLRTRTIVPPFISVEEYGLKALDDLRAAGYEHFKFLPQSDKSWAVSPSPSLEGGYVDRQSNGRDSGLFGLELPGAWMTYEQATTHFAKTIRDAGSTYVGFLGEWWDIHATY
jgi:FkbM family methyltransferase